MKIIEQGNLELIIPHIGNVPAWNIDDFKTLLDEYGDEYFLFDMEVQKVRENANMQAAIEKYKGRWIKPLRYPDKDLYSFTCSSCLYGCFHGHKKEPIWDYCPNCGTKMTKE